MKRQPKKIGIKHKLYLSLLTINILALTIVFSSWSVFRTAEHTLRLITHDMIPVTESVAEVILLSARLNTLLPQLIYMKNNEDLDTAYDNLIYIINKQHKITNTLIDKNYEESLYVKTIEEIDALDTELEESLVLLKQDIAQQIILNERRQKYKKELLKTHALFITAISPISDDNQFALMIGLEDQQNTTPSELSLQAEILATTLEIKAEGNFLAGILETALGLKEIEGLIPLSERFDATRKRIQEYLASIKQNREAFTTVSQSFNIMKDLGIAQNNIFETQKEYLTTEQQLLHDLEEIENLSIKINDIVYALEQTISKNIKLIKESTDRELYTDMYLITAVSFISLVFSLWISWFYIRKKIIHRLGHLKEVMIRTAENNFDDEIDETGQDEISDMATALSVFQRKMKQNIFLVNEVEQTAQIPLSSPAPVLRITLDGEVTIRNSAANTFFPDIDEQKFECPALEGLEEYIKDFKSNDNILPLSREITVGKSILSQIVKPIITKDQKILILFFFDITPIKQAQQKIAAQKNFVDALIENLPMGLFAKDVKDNYRWTIMNKKAEELLHTRASNWIGTTDYDHFSKDEANTLRSSDKQIIASGELLEIDEEPIATPQGTFIAHTFKMPILDENDKPSILLGMIENVTDRIEQQKELQQAKEDAEKASHAKSDFLANMSHEIRTPMNAVLGMSSLLLDTSLDQEQAEYTNSIHTAGETLLHIINDIIDISKIEAGKLTLESVEFNFIEVIQNVASLYMHQAWEKQIELLINIDPVFPCFLKGDPTRLKQILANIISNAIKFTSEGYVMLEIVEKRRDGDIIEFECKVSDTGIGIAEEHLDKVFQKFTQAEESTTRKYGGTGLDLNIVSELVGLMDGDIKLESTIGEGSTFTFNLFLQNNENKKINTIDLSDTPLRVLTIDDSKFVQNILSAIFKKTELDHVIAYSAEDALKILEKETFDICLSDYALNGMNGLNFAKTIRANKKFDNLPLFMVSGALDIGSYSDLAVKGLNGFLKKPFLPNQILGAIKIATRYKTPKDIPFITSINVQNLLDKKESTGSQDRKQYVNITILAVEDIKMNMIIIKKVLKNFGCNIQTACNGLEAVEKVKNNTYDAIFMDCQMPEMDGFEATKEIRKYEKENNIPHVPIIALTADAMTGDREKCLSAGMTDYINKPFKEAEIGKALAQWCDDKE